MIFSQSTNLMSVYNTHNSFASVYAGKQSELPILSLIQHNLFYDSAVQSILACSYILKH